MTRSYSSARQAYLDSLPEDACRACYGTGNDSAYLDTVNGRLVPHSAEWRECPSCAGTAKAGAQRIVLSFEQRMALEALLTEGTPLTAEMRDSILSELR